MYGALFGKEECFDEAVKQATLMWKHNRDEKTGLLYHAWDCEKKQPWANKETGCSEEFWGRAMGWYITALCDILDYLPKDYEKREILIEYLKKFSEALTNFQDKETGLWYQVVDKGDVAGNWTELSCSSLFTYGLSKAVRLGYIDEKYKENALRGYRGVINEITVNGDTLIIPKVCIGTGIGDYEFYINRDTVVNDLHGVGAFELMCCEIEKLIEEE